MDGDNGQNFPIVIFPEYETQDRADKGGGGSTIIPPAAARQGQRLGPKFASIQRAFDLAVQEAPAGAEPDLVLVLEVAGSVDDFYRAVARIPGFEWIGESLGEPILPDDDFRAEKQDATVTRTAFFVFSNQQALREMLRLWNLYVENPDQAFPRGLGRWKTVFVHLYDIRLWDERDRMTPELALDWEERTEHGAEIAPFEAELWHYRDAKKREAAVARVLNIIEGFGGEVLSTSLISEIAYHAIVGRIPLHRLPELQGADISLLRSADVQYLRPVAQAFVPSESATENLDVPFDRDPPSADKSPVIAILDGMPVENHPVLTGRLIVDDPDGWAADIPVNRRNHGTAMASLVVHGDLLANLPSLKRRVYTRPILRPHAPDWVQHAAETVPEDTTFVDIVYRAVTRLFSDPPAQIGRIVAINLSVGDPSRLFDRMLSPCARLLDWLSWKYNVLFIVSAGNHIADLIVELPRGTADAQSLEDRTIAILRAQHDDAIRRRLLSPGEAINALTVASTYEDASTCTPPAGRFLAHDGGLPSPYNAIGSGHRRAMKPDILFPGGRVLLGEALRTVNLELRWKF